MQVAEQPAQVRPGVCAKGRACALELVIVQPALGKCALKSAYDVIALLVRRADQLS